MEDSLQAIGERLREFRDDRDWKQFHRPTHLAAALAVEVAELQELFLWAAPEREDEILKERRDDVRDELADVVITALNFALATDIDVAAAVCSKIEPERGAVPRGKKHADARPSTRTSRRGLRERRSAACG